MGNLDLDAIEARASAATPGVWHWSGNGDDIRLMSGHTVIMDCARRGMQGAEPRFRHPSTSILIGALGLAIRSEPHNQWRITGIDHPDAAFIASAHGDVVALIAEVRRLRDERERHLATITELRDALLSLQPIIADALSAADLELTGEGQAMIEAEE